MSEYTIKTITAEDGTEYTPCETSEADGLWSNGKFIEGEFENLYVSGLAFHMSMCYHQDWKTLGAIPVKKVVPKKEPLVWTGEVGSSFIGNTAVFLPDAFAGKTVEVREITDSESVPELDLSPLTKEEFWQLQPLDTVTVPELDGLVTIRQKDETYWGFRGEHNALPAFVKCNDRCSPTPETAKRLRGKVTK